MKINTFTVQFRRSFPWKLLIFLVLFVFLVPSKSVAGLEKKAEKIIRKSMNGGLELDSRLVTITGEMKEPVEKKAGEPFFKDSLVFWKITGAGGPLGYAMMDEVQAKSGTIKFLVLFDPEGKVSLVRILRYGPQRGAEVKNKRWLKQFVGKHSDSHLSLGEDIDGISGATISSKALAYGVKRLAILLKHMTL